MQVFVRPGPDKPGFSKFFTLPECPVSFAGFYSSKVMPAFEESFASKAGELVRCFLVTDGSEDEPEGLDDEIADYLNPVQGSITGI